MHMIMFVLNDEKKVDSLLEGWRKAGVSGATLLESTGAHRRRMRIPGRFAYATTQSDEMNLTLMAIVSDEDTVKRCLAETEKITGDLSGPNTGIFSSWPLSIVKGLTREYDKEE